MSKIERKQAEVLKYKDDFNISSYASWNHSLERFEPVSSILDADIMDPGEGMRLLEGMDEKFRIWEVIPVEVSIKIKR